MRQPKRQKTEDGDHYVAVAKEKVAPRPAEQVFGNRDAFEEILLRTHSRR